MTYRLSKKISIRKYNERLSHLLELWCLFPRSALHSALVKWDGCVRTPHFLISSAALSVLPEVITKTVKTVVYLFIINNLPKSPDLLI